MGFENSVKVEDKSKSRYSQSIVLEGGEGSGKGTIARILAHRLSDKGVIVHSTRELGGLPICEAIRGVILDDAYDGIIDPITEAYLFAASRSQLVADDILPAVERGETVIIDRFVYSSYVYQGIVGGLGVDNVIEINRNAVHGWEPDTVVFLDIDPEIGLARIAADKDREVNRLDRKSLEWHHRVREGYRTLSGIVNGWHNVDADRDPSVIVGEILAIMGY